MDPAIPDMDTSTITEIETVMSRRIASLPARVKPLIREYGALPRALLLAGYEGVIVDEVHYARDWSLHLKVLYDDFPAHRLWVSDCVELRYVDVRVFPGIFLFSSSSNVSRSN